MVTDETMGQEDPLLARLLGNLCGQQAGFNLHGATKVAANDEQGRLALCKYIFRPPLANDRLKILDNSVVRLEFKKPWSDALPLSHYISWSLLLKKTFEIDTICPRCKTPLRLIAMIETEDTIKKMLSAMGLPCSFGA